MEQTVTEKDTISQLHDSLYTALNYYSNVHRGSGHFSTITTQLFEEARNIVLDYFNLKNKEYSLVFCSPRNAENLMRQLQPGRFKSISSAEVGLPLGVVAVAFNKNKLPKNPDFQSGGGTTRLISTNWVLWANAPERFEVGTPPIINIIAFARTINHLKVKGIKSGLLDEVRTLDITDLLHSDEFESLSGQELFNNLRKSIVGKNQKVLTTQGEVPFVNFDYSASTPAFKPVWKVYKDAWLADKPTKETIISTVKNIGLRFVNANADNYDVIFTSNASESINLVAESLKMLDDESGDTVVVNSLLEHSSNDLPWRGEHNQSLIHLPVDEEGFFDFEALEAILSNYNKKHLFGSKRVKLVALSGASNVLGTCNNITEIGKLVHAYGAQLLVDAAQMAAHKGITMEDCAIDFLAFSAHKVYAPFGTGVLVARKGLLAFDQKQMEIIRESGEENVPGIAALGKSLLLLQKTGFDTIEKNEQKLIAQVLKEMAEIPGITVRGIKHPDHKEFQHKIGVITFELKGVMATKLAKKLSLNGGIGIRAGCHCAHIIIKHLLHLGPTGEKVQRFVVKMLPQFTPPGMARISFGIGNTEQEIEWFVEVLKDLVKKQSDELMYSENQVKNQIQQLMTEVTQKVFY